MKKLYVNGAIALLGVALILAFAACPADTDTGTTKSDKAVLNTLQAQATAGSLNGELGDAIPESEWSTLAGRTSLTAAQTGELYLDDAPDPLPVTLTVTASPKATVTYAVVRGNIKPDAGYFMASSAETPPLAENYALYFKVESESKKVSNYYYVNVTGVGQSAGNSNITSISSVSIGDGATVIPVSSVLISNLILSPYELPHANTTGAVTLRLNRFNANQTISWAKAGASAPVPGDAAFTPFAEPASGNTLSATVSTSGLASGDKIYIKVLAADKVTRAYYGYTIDADIARLAALSIGGEPVTLWGTPGTAWNDIGRAGIYNYDAANPPATLALSASAEDNGTLAYAVTATAAAPSFTPLSAPANVALSNGTFLYIQVRSASGSVSAFYKIDIYLKDAVKLLYGQPQISTGSGGIDSAPVIDPLWNTQNWSFNVNRPNMAVSPLIDDQSMFLNTLDGHYNDTGFGHTEGRAKAFWDDGGLYVYAETAFHDYGEYNGTAPLNPAERKTRLTPSSVTDSDYLYDSLEVFTNERVAYTAGDYGVLYRVAPSIEGPSTAGSNSRISGTNPSGSSGHVEAFRNGGDYYTWIRKDNAGKELGYSIIAYIPWAFTTDAAANAVFDQNGKVATTGTDAGPAIGLELQINAVTFNTMPGGGLERAVLAWNGSGDPDQQVSQYGTVTLITGDLAARGISRD